MTTREYILTKDVKIDKTLKYKYFIDKDHPLADIKGKVYHHRHVASIKEGRWLLSTEHVHHLNKIKSDNREDNLQVITRQDHAILHAVEEGKRIKTEKNCKECGKKILTIEAKFCSVTCAINGRSVDYPLNSLDKNILSELIWIVPTTKIAEMYKVSDTAIAKKCKKFNITKPGRGYWEKLYHTSK